MFEEAARMAFNSMVNAESGRRKSIVRFLHSRDNEPLRDAKEQRTSIPLLVDNVESNSWRDTMGTLDSIRSFTDSSWEFPHIIGLSPN